jgi:hypothetical protein
MYGEVDVQIHLFLTSALVGDQWSALPLGKEPPGTHWIGGWADPRASLDNMEKRKFLTLPGLKLCPLAIQPVASRYPDYAIPAPHNSIF